VTVDVVTFGCRLNALESEALRERAAADGVTDAVVFNTCAVTGEAVRQARQAIRKAARARPGARMIVTGCAAQIDSVGFSAMPQVDLVLGNAEKVRAGALLGSGSFVGDIMAELSTSALAAASQGGRARAYVEIQNGCDHRCTFCVIPFGRGNSRSTPAELVVARARALVEAGYAEVVLTGVDLTSWGADIAGAPSLGALVRRILREVPELPRLRLSSIDAAEIDAELMACLAEEPRLMPHLHLSLQAGDDLILKRMKRRHSRADALRLIADVRCVRPETAFGADLIAGFPTETDAAFEKTLALVEDAGLAFLHVFPYSPRPGTPAARMPAVPGPLIKARAARLRAAGDAALVRHLDRRVGTVVSALVERDGRARAEDFTEVAFEGAATAGSLITGVVAGHDERRLCAPSVTAQERAPRHLPRKGAGEEFKSSNAPPPFCGGAGGSPSRETTEGAQSRLAMPA
jgi:threonylcarbamoyladenosine tRNA methylthiotransferase MtaB